MQSEIYSVTRLNNEIKGMLEGNPAFRNLFVQGEISNYKAHSSGHHYMTLKDDGAAISAVMFRSDAARLRFRLQNGMKVVARGRVSAFPKSGQVQLYLSDLMPDGAGALHMAFEQLKAKLYREGLFDEARKRPLPRLPETIALITSPTGAAVHDMLRILGRRWPVARVQLYPALVQGADAPVDLCRALTEVGRRGEAELVIIGRGGGSLEDLWAFNDERVARAICACPVPVVSAVGHEPDVTIADFVADLRAPTPSGAAELTTPDRGELYSFLRQVDAALQKGLTRAVGERRQHFAALNERLSLRTPRHLIAEKRRTLTQHTERLLLRSPKYRVDELRAELLYCGEKMQSLVENTMLVKRNNLSERIAALDALSPLKVLTRGYAVARDAAGLAVRDGGTLRAGDELSLQFAKGGATCRVLETRSET